MQRLIYRLIILSLFILPNTIFAESDYRYVTVAADNIYEFTSTSNADDLLKAMSMACTTLSRLENDKRFMNDLKQMEYVDRKYYKDRKRLARDLRWFVSTFRQLEIKELVKSGISKRNADEMFFTAGLFLGSVNEYRIKVKPIISSLRHFRKETCQVSAKIIEEMSRRERENKATKTRLRFAGLALMVVDIPLLPESAGLSALSFGLGGGVFGGGLDYLFEK